MWYNVDANVIQRLFSKLAANPFQLKCVDIWITNLQTLTRSREI